MLTGLRLFRDHRALAVEAAERIVRHVHETVEQNGRCMLALSGGSTPQAVYQQLATIRLSSQLNWSQVHVFWGDERCVPPDHPDSNYRLAWESWLSQIPIPAAHIHRIQGELPPDTAAQLYEEELSKCFGSSTSTPSFDLMLLGMGEDGHTASLFPGSPALRERQRWAVAVYEESLDSWRVTLTLPVLNAAENILFLVSGAGKATVLRRVLNRSHRESPLPAQLVEPSHGRLCWMVDVEAAGMLEDYEVS